MRTGHLVYGIDGALWAVPFDATRLVTNGSPVQVLADVSTAPAGGADFAVAQDGSLVYISGGARLDRRRLVWVDRQGRNKRSMRRSVPMRRHVSRRTAGVSCSMCEIRGRTSGSGTDQRDFHSRDSRSRFRPAAHLGAGQPGGLPSIRTAGERTVFSWYPPTELVWSSDWRNAQPLLRIQPRSLPMASSSCCGRQASIGDRPQDLDPDDPQRGVKPLLSTGVDERNAEVSPDGRWIVYQANESGQNEAVRQTVSNARRPADGRSQPVAEDAPMWAPDGRELFYYADAAQALDGGAGDDERHDVYARCRQDPVRSSSSHPNIQSHVRHQPGRTALPADQGRRSTG